MKDQSSYSERIDWFKNIYLAGDDFRSPATETLLGILIQDLAAEVVYCNQAALDLLGLSQEQLLGKISFDPQCNVIREDGTPFAMADHPVFQVVRTGRPARNVMIGVKRPERGDRVWLHVNADPVPDSNGSVARVICTLSDITPRKIAEARIRETQECFHVIADTAPVLIWASADDMLTTFFNKPWLEFTGRTMEQEIGYGWTEGVHPDDRDGSLEIYRSSFEARKSFRMEYRLRRFDGEYRWILNQGAPWWAPDGGFAGYIGCGTDITDLKRAREEALAGARRSKVRAKIGALMAGPGESLQTIVQAAVEALVDHLDVPRACIWTPGSDDGLMKLVASAGPSVSDLTQGSPLKSVDLDAVARERRPSVIEMFNDSEVGGLSAGSRNGNSAVVLCPLTAAARVVGLIGVLTRPSGANEVIEELSLITDILVLGIERRRAEESLAISEGFTNRIMESCQDCIKVLDIEGNLLYMNPGGAKALGLNDLRSLIGTDWTTFFNGAERLAAREAIDKARTGGIGTMQGRFSSKPGEVQWWDVVVTSITNAEGKTERLLAVSREITASKQAEEGFRAALEEVKRQTDQLHKENVYLQEEIKLEHNFEEIVGQSGAIKRVLYKVEQVAPLDTTVLILGETGTGKELVARAIHSLSTRNDRPLVKVNCAALPSSLIESELFGHEKGAFTDARSRKIGRFELANGGTLFLDEVGELHLDLQAKLLRVLQGGEFERLGSSTTIKVDTRILAASNRDLKAEMRDGRFREDLWYRLSVFPIWVPPLRERKEDIPLLARDFIGKLAKKLGKPTRNPSQRSMTALQNYSWPGNIRELANVIERAMIDARGEILDFSDGLERGFATSAGSGAEDRAQKPSLEDLEREFILQTLQQTGGKIEGCDGAAQSLGLNPSTLRTKMKKLGIRRRRAGRF